MIIRLDSGGFFSCLNFYLIYISRDSALIDVQKSVVDVSVTSFEVLIFEYFILILVSIQFDQMFRINYELNRI